MPAQNNSPIIRELNQPQTDFIKTEYDALRREIELQISERRRAETQTFISIAAVYAWVLTREHPLDPILYRTALSLPFILATLGLLRWIGIQLRTMTIGHFLRDIEDNYSLKNLGWETYLSERRQQKPLRAQFEGWSELTVWLIVVVATFLCLLLLPYGGTLTEG